MGRMCPKHPITNLSQFGELAVVLCKQLARRWGPDRGGGACGCGSTTTQPPHLRVLQGAQGSCLLRTGALSQRHFQDLDLARGCAHRDKRNRSQVFSLGATTHTFCPSLARADKLP